MSSLDLANQTGLIPQQFYGVNNAGTQSVQIDSNGISLQNTTTSKTLGVGAGGFLVNGTYTIDPLNLTAVCNNPTPTSLNISNALAVQSTTASPNQTLYLQASNPSVVGQIFGLTYYDASLNDLTIQTTAGQGGVLFKEYGAGASTNTAKIKQGIITLTNGTTTNTLSNTDWTGTIKTANTTQNLTHYLNFSDSSSTGQGTPQKNTSLSCNPSLGLITATTFAGDLSGNLVIGTDNASTLVYPTFVKTNGAGNKGLFIDDTSSPLTYNPSTGALTTSSFVASSAGSTNTLATGSMTIANSGGTLTINQGQVSSTASTFNVNGAGTSLNLQQGGSTKATINSTGFQTTLVNLSDDNSTTARFTGLSNSYFGTASVVYTNLQPPSGYNNTLNIGAYTNSSASTTANGYGSVAIYSPQVRVLSGTSDTSPLQISGITSKSIQQNNTSSTNTTLDLTATGNLNGRSSKVLLKGGSGTGGIGEPELQLLLASSTTNLCPPSVQLLTGTSGSNTTGVVITNNYNALQSSITSTLAVSNANINTTCDTDGSNQNAQTQFQQSPTAFNFLYNNVNSGASVSLILMNTTTATFGTNLTFGTLASGFNAGMLEKSVVNATTSGTTNLSVNTDSFQTIISTPTGARTFVLPTPNSSYIGYWFAICNRSTTQTIAVQYPSGTTIHTIPVSTSANSTNGGSSVKFAVGASGSSYFRVV